MNVIGNIETANNGGDLNNGSGSPFNNRIINGNFINNEATYATSAVSLVGNFTGRRIADRWFLNRQSGAGSTATVQIAATGYYQVSGSGRVLSYRGATTNDTSASQAEIYQAVEHDMIRDISLGTMYSSPMCLSFYVQTQGQSNVTYSVAVQNHNRTRSYVIPFTVATPNAAFVLFSFPIPPLYDGGLPASISDAGLYITFSLAPAAGYTTAVTGPSQWAWQTGDYRCIQGQSSIAESSANFFVLSDVQLTRGSTPQAWDPRPSIAEAQLVRRYFRYMNAVAGYVASATELYNGVNQLAMCPWEMRALPILETTTFTTSSVATSGVGGQLALHSGNGDGSTKDGVNFYNVGAAWTTNARLRATYCLNCELS